MKNNKGYTLIELIVSVAILAIVSLGLLSFMLYGMKMYNNISDSIKLQTESQVIVNQLREYVIDCNEGIVFEKNGLIEERVLYVWNKDASGSVVHVFRYVKEDNTIYYGKQTGAEGFNASTPIDVPTVAKREIGSRLAQNITNFDISFGAETDKTAASATLTIAVKQNEKEYSSTQVIALRNHPVYGSSWDALK